MAKAIIQLIAEDETIVSLKQELQGGGGPHTAVQKLENVLKAMKSGAFSDVEMQIIVRDHLSRKDVAVSAADPGVFDSEGHGLSNLDKILISNSTTTPSLDGIHAIRLIDADSFSVGIEVTDAGTVDWEEAEIKTSGTGSAKETHKI